MPLSFDFDGKGLFLLKKNKLDFITADTGEISSSTLSSYFTGSFDGATVAPEDSTTATSSINAGELLPVPPSLQIGEKCAMEDWETVLSESVPSLQWVMGDIIGEEQEMGINSINKVMQIDNVSNGFEFSGGFGGVNQAFNGNQLGEATANFMSQIPNNYNHLPSRSQNLTYPSVMNNIESYDPLFFLPLPYTNHQDHNLFAKQQFHSIPQYPQEERPICQEHHQGIIDNLHKAAELIQSGNQILAQGILARLNQNLLPVINKPFNRAAFYCKEALLSLLQNNNNHLPSPFSIVYKIGAYKSFSEISPVVQFANFTSNQAILEATEGFEIVHIVDFDIGLGTQWASLIQELALKNGGETLIKITAVSSISTEDQIELGFTRENLIQFAGEINIGFEFEFISIDSLHLGLSFLKNESVAVNLPVSSLSKYQLTIPLVLHFVKNLNPRIIVSIDRGCDRIDLSFPNHIIHALQSYSNLLESLDAVNNSSVDAVQKMEKFLIQPVIEKIVKSRFDSPEKTQHWRTLFLSFGFSPVIFSDFSESQAECVLKRLSVRGFHVEKRQSSLVLCWNRKELISVSAWRC